MTELRNENIYKMELRQKHSRRKEAEVVYDYEFSFPKKVFGKVEAEFVAAAEQLKMEFSISFDLLHSYLDRL